MASALIGALRVTLGLDSARFEEGMKAARKTVSSTEKNFKKVGAAMQKIGAGMSLAITLPAIALAKASVDAASDAAELQSAFDITFGKLSDSMNKWAEDVGNAMGRSTQEMQRGANAFGLFFNQAAPTREEAAKLSRSFAELAQDLSSFHNTKPEEALLALRSGLSGEAEPLRRYGIFLNDAAVQSEAASMGLKKVNGKLTDQQKIMARSSLIMKAATEQGAMGDVIRTADSHSNRMRAAAAAMEEFKVAIGTQLVPALTPLISGLTNLVNKFNEMSPAMQKSLVIVGAIAAAFGPFLMGLGTIVSVMGAVIGKITVFATTAAAGQAGVSALSVGFRALLVPLGLVGAAIGLAVAAWKNWDKILPMLQELWAYLQETLGPPLQEIMAAAGTVVADLQNAFADMWATIGPLVKEMGALLVEVLGAAIPGVLRTLGAIFTTTFSVVADLIRMLAALLRGDFMGAWDAAASALEGFVTGTVGILRAALTTIVSILEQIVLAVGRWMGAGLDAIWNRVKGGIDRVKGFFKGLWDAVVGHSYIPDMVEGIGTWMAKLDAKMVEPAKKAADRTKQAFEQLSSILARLFPEAERAKTFNQELAFIEANAKKLGLTADETAEAIRRLRQELADAELDTTPSELLDGPMPEIDWEMPKLPDLTKPLEDIGKVDGALKSLGETIKGEVIHSLQGMMRGFGSLKDLALNVLFAIGDAIIEQLINNLFKAGEAMGGASGGMGGIGGALVSLAGSIFKIPGFAQGGRPTGPSIVGERGPELFVPDTSGQIIPNNELGGRQAKVQLVVAPSDYFDARVVEISGQVMMEQAPTVVNVSKAATIGTMTRKRIR